MIPFSGRLVSVNVNQVLITFLVIQKSAFPARITGHTVDPFGRYCAQYRGGMNAKT